MSTVVPWTYCSYIPFEDVGLSCRSWRLWKAKRQLQGQQLRRWNLAGKLWWRRRILKCGGALYRIVTFMNTEVRKHNLKCGTISFGATLNKNKLQLTEDERTFSKLICSLLFPLYNDCDVTDMIYQKTQHPLFYLQCWVRMMMSPHDSSSMYR